MSDDETRQQRRHATVIFADISGFTAMSEKLDPEDVTDVMNGCFSMIERIILSHGGTIDKYIGDCVMALFGAAHAIEHAARHAVEASMEIRAGLEQFNAERNLPVPLRVHTGVNTGLVIAGDVGGDVRRDFTVMGDTVNLAARLEDASEKGQIFVGPLTEAHTRDFFDYRKLEPLRLKGKSEPVQAYEALSIKAAPDMSRLGAATRQISSNLVGREAELAGLRGRIEAFLAGDGGAISIVGDAGIGKSRLLKALADLDLLGSATILGARSDSLGSRQSYHPFVDLIRNWAGIEAKDHEPTALEKLRLALRGSGLETDPLPYVATLMGLRLPGDLSDSVERLEPDALEKLIFKAMTDVLTALARRRPLVLLFEDLHWADLSSIRLLESLLNITEEHQALFIHAFRPEYPETSERIRDLVSSRHGLRSLEIVLEPLSNRDSAALLRNLLRVDNLPHETRELIAERAEGNPFFIEEIVRSLIDEGAIRMENGRPVVTEKIHSVTIPGTVQEVIAVRVERIDSVGQHVLRLGAVIGRSFLHRILRELVDQGVALDDVLQQLEERQIIEEREVHRTGSVRRRSLVGERAFVFKHALIQETVYESLLRRQRREVHGRVARTIERVFHDRLFDFYGMLAFHYTRSEELPQAEEYLFRAGEEAVRAAASSEALAYFREASRIYEELHGEGGDPDKRFLLEKHLASALLATGGLVDARPHYDRALTHLGENVARTRGQSLRQLLKDAARILFRVYVLRGRPATRPATPQMQEALNLLYKRCMVESVAAPESFLFDAMYMVGRITTVDPRTVDNAFSQWAGVALLFSYSGLSFDLSRRISEVARSVLREERRGDLLTYHLMNFMRAYFEGNWDDCPRVDEALIQEVVNTGQLWDVDTFLGIDAEMQIDLGNFSAAEARLRTITILRNDYGYRFAETNELALRLFLAVAHRDLDQALELVQAYADRPEEMLNLVAHGTEVKIRCLRGEMPEAGLAVERAEALLSRAGRPTPFHVGAFHANRVLYRLILLERCVEAGSSAEVVATRRRLRKDLKAAQKTAGVMARIRTEVFRHAGSYAWLLGRVRRAEEWWRRSLEEGTRLGALPEVARTHLEIAHRLRSQKLPDPRGMSVAGHDSAGHLRVALGSFRALGLQRELAREEHGPRKLRAKDNF